MAGWRSAFPFFNRRKADPAGPVPRTYKSDLDKARDAQVDRIYGEWRSGAHQNAWTTLTKQLQSSPDPMGELRWLYERIARWPDVRFVNRFAEERILHLLVAKRNGEALSVIDARLLTQPDFRPRSSADLVNWIELALNGGERRIARALMKDFARLYPQDPMAEAVERLQRQLEG